MPIEIFGIVYILVAVIFAAAVMIWRYQDTGELSIFDCFLGITSSLFWPVVAVAVALTFVVNVVQSTGSVVLMRKKKCSGHSERY